MLHKLFTLATALSVATAAPTLKSRGEGNAFSLITTVTNAPSAVDVLNTGIWALRHNPDGYATLVPRVSGAVFYQYLNTTANSGAVAIGSSGVVITPGGTATVPSDNKVSLVEDQGTYSVVIHENANGIPVLEYAEGKFQACTAKTLNAAGPNTSPSDIVIGYVQEGQRGFADCVFVEFISGCSGGGQGSDGIGALGKPIVVGCQPN
ncbi:hypothetical protein K491DRAFT_722018 [Lophiostoma macrostomum CBS 122681]|uniref:Cell wall protein PhiA n=1 Tax=Lophiostoma macrostomum CBS 122681 TaxID=1314788 RepID=A0A6A6SNG6_9PLEO|nr:hypothetical protein K491DRAFT_722018 [Lophiostoma macrostomum CBS 122681]